MMLIFFTAEILCGCYVRINNARTRTNIPWEIKRSPIDRDVLELNDVQATEESDKGIARWKGNFI